MKLKFAIGSLFLIANSAFANPVEDWGQSGDWLIKVDRSVGNGCFMERDLPSGTLVRIGLVPSRDGAFFAAFNPDWGGIELGVTKNLLLDFDVSRFQGEVTGVSENGVPGGYAFFNNPEFASEFGRRVAVTITGESGASEEIDLSGSKRAIADVKECQAKQD